MGSRYVTGSCVIEQVESTRLATELTVCWLPRVASKTFDIGHAIGQHSSIKIRTNQALYAPA